MAQRCTRSRNLTNSNRGFVILDEVFADAKVEVARFSTDIGRRLTPKMWAIPRDEAQDTGTFVYLNPGAVKPRLVSLLEKLPGIVPKEEAPLSGSASASPGGDHVSVINCRYNSCSF